ncbi:MAG: MFS transporter [Solirubrobacteraceae bacterium]
MRLGVLLAVLLAPMFMYQADATIVNVANPSIHAHLHATGAQLELVIGAYLLASVTLFITGARLGQMRGYRRVFLSGLAMFTLASLACGLAPSALVLIIARIVQGLGGG